MRCRNIGKTSATTFKPECLNPRTNEASHLFLLWKELWLSDHISPYKRLSLVKLRRTLARRNSVTAFLGGKNIRVLVTRTKSCTFLSSSGFFTFFSISRQELKLLWTRRLPLSARFVCVPLLSSSHRCILNAAYNCQHFPGVGVQL